MKLLQLFYLLVFSILYTSCNVINPTEEIPTFIQVDSIKLIDNPLIDEGTLSHKIKDVWVYADNQLLGGFELPAKIPVITSGNKTEINMVAGVWENGLSGTRAKYNFLTLDTLTLFEKPTATIKHTPVFQYRTADSLLLNEDFEQGNAFKRNGADTSIEKTNNVSEIFEGIWSGKINLNDTIKTASSIMINPFQMKSGKEYFLELNYKADIPFEVYLQANFNGTFVNIILIGIKEKSTWNKIYISLSSLATQFNGSDFKLLFKTDLPTGKNKGLVSLDNIKIITRP
jgi:hypothetical protein